MLMKAVKWHTCRLLWYLFILSRHQITEFDTILTFTSTNYTKVPEIAKQDIIGSQFRHLVFIM